MLLRASGEAAMKTGSRYIAFGTRSLDLAGGIDHTTVAAHQRTLRNEPGPLVYLIEGDRGLLGDLNELRIPDGIAGPSLCRPASICPRRPGRHGDRVRGAEDIGGVQSGRVAEWALVRRSVDQPRATG